jgi:hypothetical protein
LMSLKLYCLPAYLFPQIYAYLLAQFYMKSPFFKLHNFLKFIFLIQI